MAHVTLQELKDHTGVTDKQLQLQCTDEHLEKIAYKIGNWTSYAFILKLEEWQVQSVKVNLELDYLHKIMEVLKMWKKNNVHNATYLSLVRGCLKAGDGIVAGDVCQLAKIARANPDCLDGWFEEIGLSGKDIGVLNNEGFATGQGFKTLRKDDLRTLGLTIAGRRILEKHVKTEEISPTIQATPTTTTITQATPTNNHLSPNTHLRYVYKYTFGACTKWNNIGLQLGVAKDRLDVIARSTSLHDDSEYYREMLTSWMDNGCATMEGLLDVLEGVTVGMKNIAEAVRALSEAEKQWMGL